MRRSSVDLEIADSNAVVLGLARRLVMAPVQSVQTSGQFDELEGFCQVVVATGPQSPDPLVEVAQGTEDQHGSQDTRGTQGRQHAQAVQVTGQHTVQHDEIEVAGSRLQQSITAIADRGDGESMVLEGRLDFTRGFRVVLDDQYVGHGNSVISRG